MYKHSRKILFLVTILLIVVLFLIIDLILGAFMIPKSYNAFRIKHAVYHHGLEKMVKTRAIWGPLIYTFHTNNLGFRDLSSRKVNLKKEEKKRILILGDSHTEGVGVNYQFTFAGYLQKMGEKKNIEFLNAAAVSYSPKIHYLKTNYLLNQVGLEVDEVWVFIDISDLQNELAYEGFKPSNPLIYNSIYRIAKFLKEKSFVYYSISSILMQQEIKSLTETVTKFNFEGAKPNSNTIELYNQFFSHFDDATMLRNPKFHGVSEWIYDPQFVNLAKKGMELGMNNIAQLKELCDKKGIKVSLFVHPWQLQILKGDTADLYTQGWQNFCKNNEINFINLFPLFINNENPSYVNATCYITNDNHWNETGHLRVANFLLDQLE